MPDRLEFATQPTAEFSGDLLVTLRNPTTGISAARAAVNNFVNARLRRGASVREVLGVIKSFKRQLPNASHIHFHLPTLPSTCLLRLPSLIEPPVNMSKKAIIDALSSKDTQQLITVDQALEVALEYAWWKYRASACGGQLEAVETVSKKIWEVEFELQAIGHIPGPISNALHRVRFDAGFATATQLVSRLSGAQMAEFRPERAKEMLEAWIAVRVNPLLTSDSDESDTRYRLGVELLKVKTRLPVEIRPILHTLMKCYHLFPQPMLKSDTTHARQAIGAIPPSSPFSLFPFLHNQRRTSLPILATSLKLESTLSPSASTNDLALARRTAVSSSTISSTPHGTSSEPSSFPMSPAPSSASAISSKRALISPSVIGATAFTVQISNSDCSRRIGKTHSSPDEPIPSSSPIMGPASHVEVQLPANCYTSSQWASAIDNAPDSPSSSTAHSICQESMVSKGTSSPISFMRALELPEVHGSAPEQNQYLSHHDLSSSLRFPSVEPILASPGRQTSVPATSTWHECSPPPHDSHAQIQFATRGRTSEARALKFGLQTSTQLEPFGPHFTQGFSEERVQKQRRTLRRESYSTGSFRSLLDGENNHLSINIVSMAPTTASPMPCCPSKPLDLMADYFPASPPLSPTSFSSCYSQSPLFLAGTAVESSSSYASAYVTPSSIYPSPSLSSLSTSYTFPSRAPKSVHITEERSPKDARRRGLVLSKLPFRSRLVSLDSSAQRIASDIKTFDRAQQDAFLYRESIRSPRGGLCQYDPQPRQSQESVRTLERIITPYFLRPSTPERSSNTSSVASVSTLVPVFELFSVRPTAQQPTPKRVQTTLVDFVLRERAAVCLTHGNWEIERRKVSWIIEEAAKMLPNQIYKRAFDAARTATESLAPGDFAGGLQISSWGVSASSSNTYQLPSATCDVYEDAMTSPRYKWPTAGDTALPACPRKRRSSDAPHTPTRRPPSGATSDELISPAGTFGFVTPRRPSRIDRGVEASDDSGPLSGPPETPTNCRRAHISGRAAPGVRSSSILRTSSRDFSGVTQRQQSESPDIPHGRTALPFNLQGSADRSCRVGPLPRRSSSYSTTGISAQESPPSYWDTMSHIQ